MQSLMKFLKYSFILGVFLYCCLDIYAYFRLNNEDYTKQFDLEKYATVADADIPNNIITAYEKAFPNALTNRIYPDIIWFVNSRINHRDAYAQIHFAYLLTRTSGFKLMSVAYQLDEKLSQKQCIWAYLSKAHFGTNIFKQDENTVGIQQLAKIYYNKNISELTERECLEMVIMTTSSRYNKFTKPKETTQKVNEILHHSR